MIKEDKILYGDVYACLQTLKNNSIAVAITSPPYWRQRDYGFEGQIGQEDRPEEYIGKLCTIFDVLKEKLKKDGIFFLNIGDKYLNRYGKSQLLQIPYRLAFHMTKRGWILEDIIIWFKPNHMPSSVKDRFSNTYEPVLVFSKNKRNIYKKNRKKVVRINLQQTPWKHTAVFPEKLVIEMLNRVELKDGDIVLDPFAGTGTVAKVVKDIRDPIFSKKIFSVMIERSEEFIKIIKQRTKIKKLSKIKERNYNWTPVREEQNFPCVSLQIINNDKYGEVYIGENSSSFLSALKGITTPEFKTFHREDAIYFFGTKHWTLRDLYYAFCIFHHGYVLRNMIVISEDEFYWFPIFMFVRDTTKIVYRFYIDRVRVKSSNKNTQEQNHNDLIGIKVKDRSGKKSTEGVIAKIVDRYEDNFPKIVVVQWDGYASVELVLHPQKDEFIMEGLVFLCPKCKSELTEIYDPLSKNSCPFCRIELWKNFETIPLIEEPEEIKTIVKQFKKYNYFLGEVESIKKFKNKKITNSKFLELKRINWGASPGARKLMLGEYFTKMRLYKIEQPIVAQYLNLLRISKGLTIEDIIKKLPKKYFHTVGHWFRKDFGGSIPVPEDVKLLKEIFEIETPLFDILERTVLKLQTVKEYIKGKNPGDFFEINYRNRATNQIDLFLKKLYLPDHSYPLFTRMK